MAKKNTIRMDPEERPLAPIYIRVSSEDQVQGSGLPIQLRDCKAAAEREGYAPGRVFSDEGESAKTADRPQFIELMDYLREKKPPAVIVWKLDRLARNALDSQLFRSRIKEYGTRLISATEAISDDYSGKLFADIMSSLAEYDNSLRAERCRNGMVYRAHDGWWVTTPPLGYKSVRTSDDKPTLELDPERAPLIVKLFEFVADGDSQASAMSKVNRMGLRTKRGKPISSQTCGRILANPAYAGWLTGKLAPGKPIKGRWPPIVDQTLFDRVQLRLKKGTRPRRESADFPLRGLLECPKCGKILRASYSHGRGGEYAYYHCNYCSGVRAQCRVVEDAMCDLLESLQPEEGSLDFLELIIRRYVEENFKPAKKAKDAALRKMQQVELKLDHLVDLHLDGRITQERYDRQYTKLESDLLVARNAYHEADTKKIDLLGEFSRARTLLSAPGTFWRAASPLEKKLSFPLFFSGSIKLHTKKAEPPRLEGSTIPIWYTLRDDCQTLNLNDFSRWLYAFRDFRTAKKSA